MTDLQMPIINWQAVDPNAEFSPYVATDSYGNHWSQTANREIIILTTPDGQKFEEWTERECWDKYVESQKNIGLRGCRCGCPPVLFQGSDGKNDWAFVQCVFCKTHTEPRGSVTFGDPALASKIAWNDLMQLVEKFGK